MRTKFLARLALAATLCLVLGLATTASAEIVPIPGFAPGIYVNGAFLAGFTDGAAGGSIGDSTFSATYTTIADPSILWSVQTTNNSAIPVGVTVIFGAFPTPGFPGPIVETSTCGITLTDFFNDGGFVTPLATGLPFNGTVDTNYTTNSEFVVSNFWGANPGNLVGDSANYFAFGPAFGAGFPNDLFFEVVSFTLSANDSTGISGECSFVPLPPSVLLFGSGMLGLGILGWRRKLS
jgi:hypothetical protein